MGTPAARPYDDRHTSTRLFTTRRARGRLLYRLYFAAFVAGILSLFYYRLTHVPGGNHRAAALWLAVTLAEFWFAAVWLFQQGFRWAPTFHTTYPDRLPPGDRLPSVDVFVCTADPVREPPALVANTLLSLMAYDYDGGKLSYYLSDDGGSELTFHAAYLASAFAREWLPFCRKYGVEPRAPDAYFSPDNPPAASAAGGGTRPGFLEDYNTMKREFKDMQDAIAFVGSTRAVPEETRRKHKGFKAWESKVKPRDHPSIVEILLRGNGEDRDADGNPMPTLVYVSREKRPDHPHHFKAGALNALNRVSGLTSNAPFILNVDCDMWSNNAQSLRHAMCFFLDPEVGRDIGYVQFPQCFSGITENDIYANSNKRSFQIEFFGTNAHDGPMYAGTGSVLRRECLDDGRKYRPGYQPKSVEETGARGSVDWSELEAKAKEVTSCTFEVGKTWGKEVGLMYGCAVEDVFTGLVLHSRGWRSVFCSPDRAAYLGLGPVNVNDTLIQHKRWSTGLLEIFLSDYCPWTHGVGRLKLGQIMCYSFYTLWALWCVPMLCYALLPSLAMVNGISLFPQASDPWFGVFALLGVASHGFSLGELLCYGGTVKMWWNETRMWMMKGASSYPFAVAAIAARAVGLSEAGFEITSKVADGDEAADRHRREVMEFGVASPMLVPSTVLSLVNLYAFLSTAGVLSAGGGGGGWWGDHGGGVAMQAVISGYISMISLPLYEAMFVRKDKGRMPTSVTLWSIVISVVLFYIFK